MRKTHDPTDTSAITTGHATTSCKGTHCNGRLSRFRHASVHADGFAYVPPVYWRNQCKLSWLGLRQRFPRPARGRRPGHTLPTATQYTYTHTHVYSKFPKPGPAGSCTCDCRSGAVRPSSGRRRPGCALHVSDVLPSKKASYPVGCGVRIVSLVKVGRVCVVRSWWALGRSANVDGCALCPQVAGRLSSRRVQAR